jgi:hypothetical protein
MAPVLTFSEDAGVMRTTKLFAATLSVAALVGLASVAQVAPADARELRANEASRFVVGKMFAFTCYDGTSGAGRVFADGSASGSVKMQGKEPARFMSVPPGTLRIQNDQVCASLRGVLFEPCFNVLQTSGRSFRGSVQGMEFAFCNFVRRGGRGDIATSPDLPSVRSASNPSATSE